MTTNGSGVLSTGPVALGTDTTGSYVANLGTLTGLTTTGNSGAGSTPTFERRLRGDGKHIRTGQHDADVCFRFRQSERRRRCHHFWQRRYPL